MTMRNNLDVISKAIQDLIESKVCIKNEIITFEKRDLFNILYGFMAGFIYFL